ncbi:hypothetical protein [Dactylosporangium matsuzakiense]|uniref:Uncharacterized protein n=1 Tax=Dactylosporangium matsuzakiense TaxID=53360 RepID=A0A9W6KHF7_9ACTN|nr:hypothetical protein [Dactylosporangium matsuzakiense]UWZ47585.1 hypothetical protein Dmats_14950 [Dactylosporangium matsuzakiense]GLL01583.1 hypothetical protein GCM10017581_033250 [Dactylosporangium matsuzakiense]
MDVDRDRAAYRRQWATAAAGLLNAVLAAWMIFGFRPLGPLHVCAVVLAVVTAVPLLLRSRPAFGAAALIGAGATGVTAGTSDTGGRRVYVTFAPT